MGIIENEWSRFRESFDRTFNAPPGPGKDLAVHILHECRERNMDRVASVNAMVVGLVHALNLALDANETFDKRVKVMADQLDRIVTLIERNRELQKEIDDNASSGQ